MKRSRRLSSLSWGACIALSAVFAPWALSSSIASAGNAVITWTAPDRNEDGTALTDLSGFKILYGQNASTLTQSVTLTDPGLRSYVVPNLSAGMWYFAMTATAGSGATARESQQTSVVDKDVPPDPVGLTVKGPTVYQVLGTPNRFALIPVGTVPAGTACDATETVNGRYAVARELVAWYGSTKPQIVVAECQ